MNQIFNKVQGSLAKSHTQKVNPKSASSRTAASWEMDAYDALRVPILVEESSQSGGGSASRN
ncbi:MAG: hypothetical protein MI864_15440 [Pseudomonadales bacterium]|uniref:Uncharacterized protein n=1 Tax=Oleiphilus messinensis TaxID=141451 RepID=A0A1Y0IGU4_9GAMM|nr:hypothetical protein [Oleiphilus messinensis]ARU59056.1 hypothetical protein OLMES_5072 [Oleiphilus messinensis]MCG8611919.1 hypothetical protein [Pseudomonadales bacterium]